MLTPYLTHLMAVARIAGLHAGAARYRSAISDDPWSEVTDHKHDGEVIAEVGDDIYAALSLHDAMLIADPLHHTMCAQQLLRARAEQLHRDRRLSWRRRLLNRANPRARSGTPSAAMRGAASQSSR
jgi:hypothetical protein